MGKCESTGMGNSIIPGMRSKNSATLIGLVAILLWSSIVGLIRAVAEGLGATGGAAMIYTVASMLLLATVGFTPLREMPRKYLFWGSLLFVSYELCLALSIGYASTRQQAIEVEPGIAVEQLHGMDPARILARRVHVARERLPLGAVPAGRRPRPG